MAKAELMTNVTRAIHKFGFQLKKHSPELLVIGGVAGVITSAVLACRATLKVNDVATEAKETIDIIHEETEKGNMTVEDSKKALAGAYIHTGLQLTKLYAPSVILGTLSLGCVVKSNDILRKRNVALAAAYTAVDKGFKEYRGRVIDRFGKEVDHELKYNLKSKEVEETIVDEKGREKKVKKTVKTTDGAFGSPYARFFDESCPNWEKSSEFNLNFLLAQQNYANDILRSRGHLFLNEVYDMLGMQRSQAGQVVGWVYDEENPVGDNYVDFGIHDVNREKSRDFVNGYERVILLDFNVDGDVLSLMNDARYSDKFKA